MKFWLTVVVAVAIALLALMPVPKGGQQLPLFEGADKLVHAVMFGALAVAMLWDLARNKHTIAIAKVCIALVFIAVVLYGGVIELLQTAMDEGRSGDVWDWVADAAGAVSGIVMCIVFTRRPLLSRFVNIKPYKKVGDYYEAIYVDSFPPEERRPWKEIRGFAYDSNHPLAFYKISVLGIGVGFLTAWKLDGWTYIEHFAINSNMRGYGLGRVAIDKFCKRHSPVALEVELPDVSGEAIRRIEFYKRSGFTMWENYEYVQPPYGPGLPEVPMVIMTYGEPNVSLENLNQLLKKYVYSV